ncbi:hypothetical protein [Streptomyces sp. SID3343]|uniref:hypothetical protein n=1 Tax=Streptomyces sp. SID3343 TaxID=2690260 RepID=UPI00136B1571|nr:hypothetical protein [Streptomyces sp. SID3343]MYW06497.1 hypothetical protein [Streptomyces sp. SID3343]
MGIGAGILLIALGAILTFATDWHASGINIDIVGVVLMIAGVVGIAMFLVVWAPRRRNTMLNPGPTSNYPVDGYVEQPPVERVVEERPTRRYYRR